MEAETRRAWVEVDLDALRCNARALADRAGKPLLPMVKADAYGLGAIAVVKALEPLDPWGFGVATVGEGRALREAGVRRRVLVFTPLLPTDFADARQLQLTPALGDPGAIRTWGECGGQSWHLAIDTGMNRAGIRWDHVRDVIGVLRAHPPEGAFTHFHSAEMNDGSLAAQQDRFREALAALPARPTYLHAENSPGVERQSPSPWDLARPGVFLYGVGGGEGSDIRPRPVAALRARIVELREIRDGESVSYSATYRAAGSRRIATLAVGYADGYRRALSNRGTVLVRGERVPVAGLVTMDMTMVDVTDVACAVGDVATLLGRDGDESLDVNEVARTAEMSPYELLTGLRLRLPRTYEDRPA